MPNVQLWFAQQHQVVQLILVTGALIAVLYPIVSRLGRWFERREAREYRARKYDR